MGEEVVCGRHGSTPLTFACRHAAGGIACGFWIAPPDPEYGRPDATCDLCNERMQAGLEIDSKDLVILCTHCWDEARARNEVVPNLARGKSARLTDDEQHRLIHHAVHQLQATQERAHSRWGIGLDTNAKTFMRWDFDADARSLTFSDGGESRVIAQVQMVGTYARKSGTFQWSWHTYGDRCAPLVGGLADLEGFGEVRGIERLQKAWWECEPNEGWEMTALAGYLSGCDAAYRAPFDDVDGFMLLTNMRSVV